MSINIISVIPQPSDSTSFYRAIGPLSALRKQMSGLNVEVADKVDWTTLKMSDICFLQRPHNHQHLAISRMAAAQNLPIWLDFDDAFFHILPENPASKVYGKQENIDIIKQILSMANVITVTTEHLKSLILPFVTCEIVVVPNAYDEDLLRPMKLLDGYKKRIVWRGGHTHITDLDVIGEQVVELSHKHTDFNWTFLGYAPWWVNMMRKGSYTTSPAFELIQYFNNIPQQRAAAWIFPLVDCDFNRAKSNIAWMEASYAGSKMFAQDLPEFTRPGCTNFKDGKDFKHKIKEVFETGYDPRADIKASQDFISNNLLLRNVNETRIAILEGLMDAKRS